MAGLKPGRGYYSEAEAAIALGVSIDQLRTMVRTLILKGEADAAAAPMETYQPSDLLLLRLLAGAGTNPCPAEANNA